MSDPICRRCKASLGPPLSDPEDPDKTFRPKKPCPVCGFVPDAGPVKARLDPKPEPAGKSFSGSKKARP